MSSKEPKKPRTIGPDRGAGSVGDGSHKEDLVVTIDMDNDDAFISESRGASILDQRSRSKTKDEAPTYRSKSTIRK